MVFEGFTSYYDDLLLLRAGLIDAPRYLKLLSRTVNGVRATPGRHVQSVAQSSFDAWVKYYRQDENTANATVSYYTKGSLIALLLDLRLRATGPGRSLDELMRALWKACPNGALTEAQVLAQVEAMAGPALRDELAAWVHGRGDLPLDAALATAGVQVSDEASGFAASLGLKLSEGPVTGVQVKTVLAGGTAAAAGLSAGDELIAVDGWRIRRLEDATQWLRPNQAFDLLIVRQQRLRTLRVALGGDTARQLNLSLQTEPAASAADLRRAWLGQ